MSISPPRPPANAKPEPFRVERRLLPGLVATAAADRGVAAEAVTLADFSGDWLPDQLADLLDRAQHRAHRVIAPPSLRGAEVGIIAYADHAGLILALCYEPLFVSHGAQIDGGWEEPGAYIPMRPDGASLDLADLEGILAVVVDRANALLAVLVAATAA